MPDEIDLNEEEEAALEAVWERRVAARQQQQAPPPAPEPAAFANPDHGKQLRGRDGAWVNTPPVRELSDASLEELMDEVVEEALLRKARRKKGDDEAFLEAD